MDFVKKVVEEELKRAEGHLNTLNFHYEQIELEMKNNRAQAAQTEKHITEMKEYLNPNPIAQQLVAHIKVDADEIVKRLEKSLYTAMGAPKEAIGNE